MPRTTRKPDLTIKTKLLIAIVTFLFLVLVIASFFGNRGLIEIYRTGKSLRALELQVEELRGKRDELHQEIQELRENPHAVRAKARKLGLGSPEEEIILK